MTQSTSDISLNSAERRLAEPDEISPEMPCSRNLKHRTAKADRLELETLPRPIQGGLIVLVVISIILYFTLSHGVHNHIDFLLEAAKQVAEKV